MKLKISVDSGKHSTEYAYKNCINLERTASFKTVIQTETNTESDKSGFVVNFDRKYYLVGNEYSLYLDHDNTKLGENHYICVYTAICNAIKDVYPNDIAKNIKVELAINVPLDDYRKKVERQKYYDFYMNKYIKMKVNGVEFQFTITKVIPFCESFGILYREYERFHTKKNLVVIDLGGRNDTHMVFSECKPKGDFCIMGNNGILTIIPLIANELTNKYKSPFSESDIKLLINDESARLKVPEFEGIFRKHAMKLLNNVKSTSTSTSVNHVLMEFAFTGGGSDLLKDYISEVFAFEYFMTSNPYYDNAIGGLRYMENINE